MNAADATVSVVIPAYNAAGFVARSIDSVLGQTVAPFEVIVVNDGSTDGTAAVLAGYAPQLRVVDQHNQGLSRARNAGIAAARGRYVAFLDADDWWLPDKLASQVPLLQGAPDAGFCSCAARVVSSDGRQLNVWSAPASNRPILHAIFENLSTIPGSGSGVVARRDLLQRVGGFDAELRSLEDVDLWMRLAAISGHVCVAEPMAVILRADNSMSRNLDVMRASALRVLHKNRHLLPSELQGRFWQSCVASCLTDYSKWEYRAGRRMDALRHLAEAFRRAPLDRGRLALGLMFAMVLGSPV